MFPLIYISVLLNFPESFAIEDDVRKSNILEERERLALRYKPAELQKKMNQIRKISSADIPYEEPGRVYVTPPQLLDQPLWKLDGNTIATSAYTLSARTVVAQPESEPEMKAYAGSFLTILDRSTGSKVELKHPDPLYTLRTDSTIRQFVAASRPQLEIQYSEYLKKYKKAESGYWTFNRILPHSINMFLLSNFTAKSYAANYISFIHFFTVGLLLFGLIGTLFNDLAMKLNGPSA